MSTLDNLYNALTRRVQTAKKDITREVVEDWVESTCDKAQQIRFVCAALSELESGNYTPEEIAEEILQSSCLDN